MIESTRHEKLSEQKMHMNTKLLPIFAALTTLFSTGAFAQQGKPAPHPEAEKAMAKIVLEKDFGKDLKFHSREVVTMQQNDRVPGLNGLMFMRWKGDQPGTEIMASVQWFEKKDDLLNFYATTTKREDYKLGEFDGASVWLIGENGYSWTDGEHFLVTLGGDPRPPDEMIKEWLALIGSRVAELEKEAEKNPEPAEWPKNQANDLLAQKEPTMEDYEEIAGFIYLLILVLSAMHVYRDCRRIGERAFLHISGTIILWPLYYLIGWLWIWPGSLRRWLSGGSIDELVQAKAFRRRADTRKPGR
jgi:hypothetical protein